MAQPSSAPLRYMVRMHRVLALSFCVALISRTFSSSSTWQSEFVNFAKEELIVTELETVDHQFSSIVYGHIHIAKSAGTELNRALASKYEGVCGTRGYSLDFYSWNKRNGSSMEVSARTMAEIGFENCDFISHEINWKWWRKMYNETFASWNTSLELHVPCRDPLDHLMSQCYKRKIQFRCNLPIKAQVAQCLGGVQTFFSMNLIKEFPQTKCFLYNKVDEYTAYMKDKLEPRRIQFEYTRKPLNSTRRKGRECIWKNKDLQSATLNFLLKLDYYKFCSNCIKSDKNLLAEKIEIQQPLHDEMLKKQESHDALEMNAGVRIP